MRLILFAAVLALTNSALAETFYLHQFVGVYDVSAEACRPTTSCAQTSRIELRESAGTIELIEISQQGSTRIKLEESGASANPLTYITGDMNFGMWTEQTKSETGRLIEKRTVKFSRNVASPSSGVELVIQKEVRDPVSGGSKLSFRSLKLIAKD